jgi:FtsH ternary system domain X7
VLDRVAVHQTRLRTPGLGLDAKGVALGARGLVLLPSIDRLVAFLALYTRQGSLADILRSLAVEVVRSKLGAREVTLTFGAEGSDRMDRIAEVARLAGGYTFTGTSRHFVQYRDAAAPFGYDVGQITPSDAALALYHNAFSQTYDVERAIEVRALLLRLEPHPDPSTHREPGPRWIVAEAGLGPALIHYFVRSSVDAEVGVAEWPPASSFDDGPVVRYLFRVPEVPERMSALLASTPGLGVFLPVAPGAAVELGFRHPVNLRACPVFAADGLALFRGKGSDVLELSRLPALGDVSAFARVELRKEVVAARPPDGALRPDRVSIALRLMPSTEPWRTVTASWVKPEEMSLLRHVAYALGPETLRRTRIALTAEGAFLRHPTGIEGIPVGEFFREIRAGLYIPAGWDAVPAVAPDVLYRALGSPSGQVVFLARDGRVVGVPGDAFVPLETALLEAQAWSPLSAISEGLTAALATELPEVFLAGVGLRPMRDVPSPADLAKSPDALPPARPPALLPPSGGASGASGASGSGGGDG